MDLSGGWLLPLISGPVLGLFVARRAQLQLPGWPKALDLTVACVIVFSALGYIAARMGWLPANVVVGRFILGMACVGLVCWITNALLWTSGGHYRLNRREMVAHRIVGWLGTSEIFFSVGFGFTVLGLASSGWDDPYGYIPDLVREGVLWPRVVAVIFALVGFCLALKARVRTRRQSQLELVRGD